MGAIKEVTGAVMPYAILGGVALIAYKYRDEIVEWLKGEIVGEGIVPPAITPEGVTIPGPAGPARDVGQGVADWLLSIFRPDSGPVVAGPTGAETAAFVGGQIASGQAFIIPGLSTWETREAAAAPSPLAAALGLTGDPVSGYSSVMAPISEPSPVVNVYGYPEGVYYQDGYRLTITPEYYDVSRRDDRYAGQGQTEGWASVLWGAGAATWYSPALATWAERFGL